MASSTEIEHALYEFTSNFGRGQDHMNRVFQSWSREFETTPGLILREAVHQVIRDSTDSFIPPLGKVIDVVRSKMGGTHVDRSYRKCPDCDKQGFREVAVHYQSAPIRFTHHHGMPHCVTMTVNCNCHFGQSRPGATLDEFIHKAERTLAETDRLRYYYVSDRGRPLSREQTMLEEDYQLWLDSPKQKNNPYRKMLSALSRERAT